MPPHSPAPTPSTSNGAPPLPFEVFFYALAELRARAPCHQLCNDQIDGFSRFSIRVFLPWSMFFYHTTFFFFLDTYRSLCIFRVKTPQPRAKTWFNQRFISPLALSNCGTMVAFGNSAGERRAPPFADASTLRLLQRPPMLEEALFFSPTFPCAVVSEKRPTQNDGINL